MSTRAEPHVEPTPPSGRPRAVELAVLAALCVAGFALRLRGIDFLLPSLPLSDSFPIALQVDWLRGKTWAEHYPSSLIPYPPLLGWLTSLLPAPPDVPANSAAPLPEHLRLGAEPWLQIRLMATALSMLIVPATWWLARSFLRPAWALVAAALVATSLLHVNYAVHEKPHGPLSAFTAVAVLAALWVRRRGGPGACAALGLASAACIAMLQSGFAVLPLLPAALIARERGARRASPFWILLTLALIGAAAVVAYPDLFATSAPAVEMQRPEGTEGFLAIEGHQIYLQSIDGSGFEVLVGGLWSNDPVLFLGCVLGGFAALLAWRSGERLTSARARDLAVVLAFALPYFVVFGVYPRTLERFALPLLPFYALLAAFGFERALRAVVARAPEAVRGASVTIASSACVLVALVPCWRLGELRQRPDTFAQVADVLVERARPHEDRIVVLTAVDLPLLYGAAAMQENGRYPERSHWVRYQMRLPPATHGVERYEVLLGPGPGTKTAEALRSGLLPYLREAGARFVVIPAAAGGDDAPHRELRENGELVARFTPEAVDGGGLESFTYIHKRNPRPWSEPFFARLFAIERLGRTIEVYRLR